MVLLCGLACLTLFRVASGTLINGYEKCTESGLRDLVASMRSDIENFYLDFGREVEAQADASIRNLWFNTPHPSSFPRLQDLYKIPGKGCLVDNNPKRLSDIMFTNWHDTHWYNDSCAVEMLKQGHPLSAFENPLAAGCTYPHSNIISDYCVKHYPHCDTDKLVANGTNVDYLDYHYSEAGGERGWKLKGNKFCPTYCLQPARFGNNFNDFAMQLSDGAELRWHELNSKLFGGGVSMANLSKAAKHSFDGAEKFHSGYGWAWGFMSQDASLFRFIPELQTLFGADWCTSASGNGDHTWPVAHFAYPTANPTKGTIWTMPYKDLAWQKFQVSAFAPIYDGPDKQQFLGVVFVDVFMDSTEAIVNTRKPTPNSQMMLLNKDFKIIFATTALYSMLICPGNGTIHQRLCTPCVQGDANNRRAATPGSTCLDSESFSGKNTSFSLAELEGNGGNIDFMRDAHFVSEADAQRLYKAAQGKDASFVKITLLRNSRVATSNENQCLGSPSCTYYFFFQRFMADNMGWTILIVLPEEDLLRGTGVEIDASGLDGKTVSILDDQVSDEMSVIVRNTGILPMKWSTSGDLSSKVRFPLAQGVIAGGSNETVKMQVNGAALNAGSHTLTALISVQDELEGSCLSRQLSAQLSVVRKSTGQTCPAAKYLEETSANCLPCRKGSFKSSTGTDCILCAAGTHSTATGAVSCDQCPPGSYCPRGASSPEPCPVGMFELLGGAEECTACPTGTFAATPGNSHCASCPGDMTTLVEGGSTISACVCQAGSFGPPASSAASSSCTSCPPLKSSAPGAQTDADCSLTPGGGVLIASAVLIFVGSVGAFLLYRFMNKKNEAQKEAHVQAKLMDGIKAVRKLAHPMVLISAQNFIDLSEDMIKTLHEGIRNDGNLVFLDTNEVISAFKQAGHTVVFFSYQWLSWDTAGPNAIQLECMKSSLKILQQKLNLDQINSLYVWLDIIAIPQCNTSLKGLAVNSLYTYARQADVLVIVSPESIHANLQVQAGTISYKKRAWCRVEQMAFFCASGLTKMFHCVSPSVVSEMPDGWMDDAAMIFDGEMTCCKWKHKNGEPCDKLSLVSPLIGMYFDLYTMLQSGMMDEHAKATWAFIENKRDLVFPKTLAVVNGNDQTLQKELFGNLIARTNAFVQKDVNAAVAFSNASSASKVSHASAHDNNKTIVPSAAAKDILSTKNITNAVVYIDGDILHC